MKKLLSLVRHRCLTVGVAALAMVVWVGCQQDPERLPYAEQDCAPGECPPVGHGVRGGSTLRDASSSAEAGRDGASEASVAQLEVHLRQAIDLESTATMSVDLPSEAFDLTDTTEQPTAVARAGQPLEIPAQARGGWWLLRPTDAQSGSDDEFFASLVWLEPGTAPVVQPLFSQRLLDDLGSALAFNPTFADPSAAHAVLRLEDEQGRPLAGVVARVPHGVIAYGVGGTASDAFEASTGTGVVLWLNIPAEGIDSQPLSLRSEYGEWQAPIPVRAAAVTVATLVSPLP